ncbi:MAG: hypothetical protein VYA80_03525 [Pseudomonadota bacterium]|nr:hypothetical protein [Pseudomonadota bacterium]
MMHPDITWQGRIALHELLFGTWISYIFLTLIWEKALRAPLEEWQYMMLTCMAASFFVINHFFFFAPFYYTMINIYSLLFLFVWWHFGIRNIQKSTLWKLGAILLAIVYSFMYVIFELSARNLIEAGLHEIWITIIFMAGFAGIIQWRRKKQKINS